MYGFRGQIAISLRSEAKHPQGRPQPRSSPHAGHELLQPQRCRVVSFARTHHCGLRTLDQRFWGQSANSPSLRLALRVLRFAAQRNCDLTPKTICPRRHPFPVPVPNLDSLPKPLWMRRGAQGKVDQGRHLFEAIAEL